MNTILFTQILKNLADFITKDILQRCFRSFQNCNVDLILQSKLNSRGHLHTDESSTDNSYVFSSFLSNSLIDCFIIINTSHIKEVDMIQTFNCRISIDTSRSNQKFIISQWLFISINMFLLIVNISNSSFSNKMDAILFKPLSRSDRSWMFDCITAFSQHSPIIGKISFFTDHINMSIISRLS